MTRKTILLAGVGVAAVVGAGIVGQQLYPGQALQAVETGLAQLGKGGIAGYTVAWTGQERSGDTVVLRDVTVTAPGGRLLGKAARSVVKPSMTGHIDVTSDDVSLTAGDGADRLLIGQMAAENIALGKGPALELPVTADAWLTTLDDATVRAIDLTARVGSVGAAPQRTAGHLNSLDAALASGRMTRFVAEGFTARVSTPTTAANVQDAALDRLELSGFDLRRILVMQESELGSDVKDMRAAIRSGELRLSIRGLRFGPVVLDGGELILTPAGTDHLALTGGHVGPQQPRPAALEGIELVSLVTDNRFVTEGWTGEASTEMKGFGRLRLVAKGKGQTTGAAPLTLQRLAVQLEDGGIVARIAAANGIAEQNRLQWAQMMGDVYKGVLGGVGLADSSGLDARLAAFLGKGTPLEFAIESTHPGGVVVPNVWERAATAWVPASGSLRVVAP